MRKLTAEQVQTAIFNGSSYASYDGAKYYADGINMQAIADELNAWYVNSEPIVRCKDCKFCELQTVSYSDKVLSVCNADWCEGAEGDNPLVEPDGFCAWGERKSE